MIRTISPQDMREMERAFLEGTGYPSILLMEHAAQAVVDALSAYAKAGSRVLFVCGSGNNGGDGCAAARLWMQRGGQADVWLLKSPSQMKGDAGVNGCLLNSCGAPLNVLYSEAPEVPGDCAAIVDALYGTGLSRELDGAALSAVRRINESGLPVVSVDIPSGVDGATGQVLGDAVRARETVAFHRAKHGLLLYPGRAYAGKLTVADIGILPEWDGAQGIDVLEEADDYYFPPITGTYLRLSRLLIAIVTYFLTPTFLLLMEYPQWIPKGFEFIAVRDTVYIPLIWQLLLLELAIDGLKLAAVNTPNMLSTPLSVMAALVLGEFSVKSGWFNSEVMLYMAFVAVANYTQNSLELGYALKFMRIINLVLTAIFGVWGYVGGIVILAVSLLFNRTVSSRSYLYPLVPFHGKQLGHQLFRTRLPAARK